MPLLARFLLHVVLSACIPSVATATSDGPTEIIVDDADGDRTEVTGYWTAARPAGCAISGRALTDAGTGVDGVVRFLPDLPAPGRYEVFLHWPRVSDDRPAATNAPIGIRHAGGTTILSIDMRADGCRWVSLGTYTFELDRDAFVDVLNDEADGPVFADAVLFRAR